MLGHLISFLPVPELGLIFWDKDKVSEFTLLGKNVSMKFSDSVLCTGYREQEKHNKCLHKMRGNKQCNYCKHRDIAKVYTRLDFEGFEEMKEEYTHQEFSVYLAAFGKEIVKCGVTRSERVEIRTREQGADFWIELLRFDNAEKAYNAEIGLQNKFDLRNFVRNDTKLKLLHEQKSSDLLESKTNEIKASGLFNNNICNSSIQENSYPIPESFNVAYSIDGLVTGSKGNLLFYSKENSHFVVQMHQMVGRVFLLKE